MSILMFIGKVVLICVTAPILTFMVALSAAMCVNIVKTAVDWTKKDKEANQ